jgi:hypothetical protein
MIRYLLFALSTIVWMTSCKKEEEKGANSAPLISIVSVSADSVTEFQDSLLIVLNYEDAEGNVGNPNPDIFDLELKDSRLASPDLYHVQPLAPEGYELHIRGTLKVKVNTLFLLGNGSAETTRFTIRLRDLDGVWSEPAETDPITIVCP